MGGGGEEDYFDTYAPTPSASSINLFAGIALRNGVKLSHHGDP